MKCFSSFYIDKNIFISEKNVCRFEPKICDFVEAQFPNLKSSSRRSPPGHIWLLCNACSADHYIMEEILELPLEQTVSN